MVEVREDGVLGSLKKKHKRRQHDGVVVLGGEDVELDSVSHRKKTKIEGLNGGGVSEVDGREDKKSRKEEHEKMERKAKKSESGEMNGKDTNGFIANDKENNGVINSDAGVVIEGRMKDNKEKKKRKSESKSNDTDDTGRGDMNAGCVDDKSAKKVELVENKKGKQKVHEKNKPIIKDNKQTNEKTQKSICDGTDNVEHPEGQKKKKEKNSGLNLEDKDDSSTGFELLENKERLEAAGSELKECWKEIAEALPWRHKNAVYSRAHILFERSESRTWTKEELEEVREYHEKYGPKWRQLADEIGRNRIHVKDAFRQVKLANKKVGQWFQEEYQTLFNLVDKDLRIRASMERKSKHGMLRDNIGWEAISEQLTTRTDPICCQKWYNQLTSALVACGKWADGDDYRLLMALDELDATCKEDVDWDNVLEHHSGDVCRKRWNEMVRHIGEHGYKSFSEQVELLSKRYCPDVLEARETYDNKPIVD